MKTLKLHLVYQKHYNFKKLSVFSLFQNQIIIIKICKVYFYSYTTYGIASKSSSGALPLPEARHVP